jgi:hypothetical protein
VKRVSAVAVQILLAQVFASVVLLLAAPVACVAQQGGPGSAPVGPRIDPEAERIREEQKREMQLRNVEPGSARTSEGAVKAAAEQLSRDFKRIQIIRNEIAHAVKDEGVLDYKKLSEQTSELKKRSLRMQRYLALRGADEQGQAAGTEPDEGQMKDALVRLCKHIDSFVANPRFASARPNGSVGRTSNASGVRSEWRAASDQRR